MLQLPLADPARDQHPVSVTERTAQMAVDRSHPAEPLHRFGRNHCAARCGDGYILSAHRKFPVTDRKCSGPDPNRVIGPDRKTDIATTRSTFGDDDLEIFAWHHHGGVAGPVHAYDQCVQVVVQFFLLRRLEGCERFQHRAIEGLEHVEEVRR